MHQVIVGITETGKTTLAKILNAGLVRSGACVLVWNPHPNHDFIKPDARTGNVSATAEFRSKVEFLDAIQKQIRAGTGKPIFVTIDEAHMFFKKVNCPNEWMGLSGRHVGLNLTLITPYYASLNVPVRSMCRRLYIFHSTLTSAERCADEFGVKNLVKACGMPPGHYLRADHHAGGLTEGRVF